MISLVKSILTKFTGDKFFHSSLLTDIEEVNFKLRNLGLGNYGNLEITGESYLLQRLGLLITHKNPIIFDVGANIGSVRQYKNYIRQTFQSGKIYAFEPNPFAYQALCSATNNDTMQYNLQFALGEKIGRTKHYSYSSLEKTELASSNKQIFADILKSKEALTCYEVKVTTIDSYCKKHQIKHINYLKIDVEGSEYDVLKGAKKMLSAKSIDYIQFEFNIHNIYSRIFIKDYFDLLKGYHFYRLAQNRLIPLGKYSTDYEVFRYQNILATKFVLKA